jgi:hypothetical protein
MTDHPLVCSTPSVVLCPLYSNGCGFRGSAREQRCAKATLLSGPPSQAVLQSPDVPEETKGKLPDLFRSRNPVRLKRDLDPRLEAFWHLAVGNNPGGANE